MKKQTKVKRANQAVTFRTIENLIHGFSFAPIMRLQQPTNRKGGK